MTNLPRLFTDKGELIEVDASAFDAATRARHAAIVTAYRANKAAEQTLANMRAEVTTALSAVKNTEEFYNERWPRQQFHDLWKENFGGGPRNRMTGRG
jgi:multidrug resistance efflux pump